jgi:hypothetical protein
MKYQMQRTSRRATRFLSTCVLLGGGIGGAVLLGAGTASADPCGPTTPAVACDVTGTATVNGGQLSLSAPATFTWGDTLNGFDQEVADTIPSDQQYQVDDATGSGAGWDVEVAPTTFTDSTTSDTLADTTTLSTNGSNSNATAPNGPATACSVVGSGCTLPSNSLSYPVHIFTMAGSPPFTTIFDTSSGSGLGSIQIGGPTGPVVWWVNLPANTVPGTYVSTLTLQVNSGP